MAFATWLVVVVRKARPQNYTVISETNLEQILTMIEVKLTRAEQTKKIKELI